MPLSKPCAATLVSKGCGEYTPTPALKRAHSGTQGERCVQMRSRPMWGGSVGLKHYLMCAYTSFSSSVSLIQSSKFCDSSSVCAIWNRAVRFSMLSKCREVSNRSQMLSSVSAPVACMGSSDSGRTCSAFLPSRIAWSASSSWPIRSRGFRVSVAETPHGLYHGRAALPPACTAVPVLLPRDPTWL